MASISIKNALGSIAVCAATVACLLLAAGCAQLQTPLGEPAFGIGGLWHGESRALQSMGGESRLGAVNRISFFLRQNGSQIRGDYRCAYGNTVCRDANKAQQGEIVSGSLGGADLALRVMFPADLSSCLFNARVSSLRADGTYRCYQGGGIVEQGIWRAQRFSSDVPLTSPASGQ